MVPWRKWRQGVSGRKLVLQIKTMPHNPKAKKRGVMTRKHAAQRMELIRRENVQRHNAFAARSALKAAQVNAQKVAIMQQELDRLHEASIRGSGLDAVRINRMNALKEVIGSYKNVNPRFGAQTPF